MEYPTDNQAGSEKNKGGRPSSKKSPLNKKITFYLSEEEQELLSEFLQKGWGDYNASGACRFLVLRGLKEWAKRGKKDIGLQGRF